MITCHIYVTILFGILYSAPPHYYVKSALHGLLCMKRWYKQHKASKEHSTECFSCLTRDVWYFEGLAFRSMKIRANVLVSEACNRPCLWVAIAHRSRFGGKSFCGAMDPSPLWHFSMWSTFNDPT